MIDIKAFKKVQDDGKVAVLEHPDGHKIHIVHSSLKKPLQAQLKALPLHQAEGSDAPVEMPDDSIGQGALAGAQVMSQAAPSSPVFDSVEQRLGPMDPQAPQTPEAAPAAMDRGLSSQPSEPQNPFNSVPGYKEQLQGIQGQGTALTQQGNTEAKAYKEAAAKEQDTAAILQKDLSSKAQEIDKVTQEIGAGKIDPNHYMDSLGTAGKIQTAIGLILGGIGGGQTHQANPALQFLNSQIDRDLNAQKANIDNKHNLLSALEHQYGDKIVAENMFRAIRSNTLSNQIGAAGAQAKGQLGAAAAAQAKGQLDTQTAQYMRQATLANMQGEVTNGSSDGSMSVDDKAQHYLRAARVLDPKGAEEFEKRYIPGVGVAQVPLEPKDREIIQKKSEMSHLLEQAQRVLTGSGTLGTIAPSKKAEAKSIQNQLQLRMGELAELTRFTPEENHIYSQTVPDLTGTHFTGKDQALLSSLKDTNNNTLNTLYKQKGINKQVEDTSAVKGKDGRMYTKSADGKYMVPVR